jgi:hypothetical protein
MFRDGRSIRFLKPEKKNGDPGNCNEAEGQGLIGVSGEGPV